MKKLFNFILPVLMVFIFTLFMVACGNDEPTTLSGEEDHAHGPDTHVHEETAADTAGTYVDTTGAFFGAEDSVQADHEHGPDTHTH